MFGPGFSPNWLNLSELYAGFAYHLCLGEVHGKGLVQERLDIVDAWSWHDLRFEVSRLGVFCRSMARIVGSL